MKNFIFMVVLLYTTLTAAQDLTAVINLPPGQALDINARLLIKKYDELFGTQSMVANRAGASGQIGIDYFLNNLDPQKALLFSSHGGITDTTPEKFSQLVSVAEISRTPMALIVRKDFPAKTYKEFVEYNRKNPKKTNIGVVNSATSYATLGPIEARGRYQTNHVLYTGSSNVRPEVDVAAGNLDGMWNPVSAILTSGVIDRVRILAIAGNIRIDVPGSNHITYGEDPLLGYSYLYNHLWVNAKMDKYKQEQLNTRFNAILKSNWAQEKILKYTAASNSSTIEENTQTWVDQRNRHDILKKKYQNSEKN